MSDLDDLVKGISADAKWRLMGHAEETKKVEAMLTLPHAAERIATYILERDERLKKNWAVIGPCGRHPLVSYVAGAGFDGAESYKQFKGCAFPMKSQELTDAGLVRVCELCREELRATNTVKQ